jgi:hypothetical protein
MKKMRIYIWMGLLLVGVAGAISCSSEDASAETQAATTAKPAKDVNPNGSSELAKLMRNMYDHGQAVKKQIQEQAPKLDLELFQGIHSATPTDPNVRTPEFEGFANSWQTSMKNLGGCAESDRPQMFNMMVDNCMSCHTAFCPGPRMRIKKLYIPVVQPS